MAETISGIEIGETLSRILQNKEIGSFYFEEAVLLPSHDRADLRRDGPDGFKVTLWLYDGQVCGWNCPGETDFYACIDRLLLAPSGNYSFTPGELQGDPSQGVDIANRVLSSVQAAREQLDRQYFIRLKDVELEDQSVGMMGSHWNCLLEFICFTRGKYDNSDIDRSPGFSSRERVQLLGRSAIEELYAHLCDQLSLASDEISGILYDLFSEGLLEFDLWFDLKPKVVDQLDAPNIEQLAESNPAIDDCVYLESDELLGRLSQNSLQLAEYLRAFAYIGPQPPPGPPKLLDMTTGDGPMDESKVADELVSPPYPGPPPSETFRPAVDVTSRSEAGGERDFDIITASENRPEGSQEQDHGDLLKWFLDSSKG